MCTPYIIFLFSDSGGIRTHDKKQITNYLIFKRLTCACVKY